ncbi:MAG: iron uptake porin [Cyanobacteria bacterium P01_C01_bin.89]
MLKVLWNAIRISPALLGASMMVAQGSALANEIAIDDGSIEAIAASDHFDGGDVAAMEQVTSVSQLSDVSPTDWAFQALQSLVERYGCIAGYPDGTFRGNRALTRYEFAAGLNACLDRVNELIAAATDPLATKEDLQTLQRLQEEFAAELAEIRGRVDALEARTTELEANQFSTTTKLRGEVIFALGGSNDPDFDGDDSDQDQVTFSHRVRLNFDTSFTGKDRLRVRLQTGNSARYFGDRTVQARYGFEARDGNIFEANDVYYRFPFGDGFRAYVSALGLGLNDVHDVVNPFFASSGSGAVFRFSRRDPLIFRGPDGIGGGISYKKDRFSAAVTYLADDADDPTEGNGLFNGEYSATASATYKITDAWKVGLAYSYRYFTPGNDLTSGTGGRSSRRPFGSDPAVRSHNVGIQTSARISDGFNISGWASASFADEIDGNDEATLFNWAVHLAFPDLFKEGNVGGIIVGQPPYVIDGDGVDEDDPTFHIEALYKVKLNSNIAITPAVLFLTSPNNDDDNDAAVVGVVRTTFKF